MRRVSAAIIAKIKDVDIIDLILEYVDLTYKNGSYLGLCPFHTDSKPSFRVHPTKKMFKCFGCGKGGSLVTFIMSYHSIGYLEAIELIAKKYHIELPPPTPEEEKEYRLLKALEELKEVYKEELKSNSYVIPLIEQLPDLLVKKYEIGLARSGKIPQHLIEPLTELGYISPHGTVMFFNRVIFPIKDVGGKVRGFYGRALQDESGIKHLNSRDSDLFHKSQVLFGADIAFKAARASGYLIITEGPKDALGYASAGYDSVVATCGTALTPHHARIIASRVSEVVIAYDADKTGFTRALAATKTLVESAVSVSFHTFPPGADPFEVLVINKDVSSVKKVDLAAFIIEGSKQYGLDSSSTFAEVVGQISNLVWKHEVIESFSKITKLDVKEVIRIISNQFDRSLPSRYDEKEIFFNVDQQLISATLLNPVHAGKVYSFIKKHVVFIGKQVEEVLQCLSENPSQTMGEALDVLEIAGIDKSQFPLPSHFLNLSDDQSLELLSTALLTYVSDYYHNQLVECIINQETEGMNVWKTALQNLPLELKNFPE